MHISEVLNAAADILERDGWMQRPDALDRPGPTCASLAMGRASREGHAAAYAALSAYLGRGPVGVINWNDADGRTAHEVVEALRACAVIEASREHQPAAALVS